MGTQDKPDLDRVAGALLGLAAGDALGAGYEFTHPGPDADVQMRGGGAFGWAPGQWTDDTDQAVAIAKVTAATTADRTIDLEAIGANFLAWFAQPPKDAGNLTAAVLGAAATPADLAAVAAERFTRTGRAAGNGALMRTSPVALAHLGNDQAIVGTARSVAALTHADPLAAESCVLWCIAIDRAVREGRLDGVHDGVDLLPADRRPFWRERLAEAESEPPTTFTPNGFTVTALQAAHAVIQQTPVPESRPCAHLQDALVAAVRIGDDTDTVAAIAGQVLGARWGASAVPWRWQRLLHGWPGLRADDLIRLAVLTATHGVSDDVGWPAAATTMPHAVTYEKTPWCGAVEGDPGLLLGNQPGLPAALDAGATAVVSLCRVGTHEVPEGIAHHRFRLVDKPGQDHNANLSFVIAEAVEAVGTLRAEGHRVFLHCQGGRSRSASVAAAYLSQRLGVPARDTLPQIKQVLPQAHLNVFGPLLDAEYG